jgi:poly(3-hydroxybutyrate) depolymerase
MRLTATLLAALELGICTRAQAAVEADPITGPVASKGCAIADLKFPATPGGPSKALKFGDRTVRITLPKNYVRGTPAPLILAYHDQNSTAIEMEAISLLSRLDRNPDAIVVYPQAGVDVCDDLESVP